MSPDPLHAAAQVAAVALVTFLLRATPFILFGSGRELPPAVKRASAYFSPVIILGLIIWSYTGLEWRTAAPYLAGIAAVILELWKRNPMISILASTALYMVLVR